MAPDEVACLDHAHTALSTGSRLTQAFTFKVCIESQSVCPRSLHEEGSSQAIPVMLTVHRMLCLVSCLSVLYFFMALQSMRVCK